MSAHRLLIATDVPFWNRSTGAEQRIAALVDFFLKKSIAVRTFYVLRLNKTDRQRIESQNLDVVQGSSDQPPNESYKKVIWYAKATLFRSKQFLQQLYPAAQTGPLTLEDYRWPWAVDQFAECVNEFKPDSILIEYVKMSYLLSGLEPAMREHVLCLVDTHDVLHIREQQFRERGYPHWLTISREEEAEALQLFDVILAIQQAEAEVFRKLSPDSKTIVVGHSLEQQAKIVRPHNTKKKFVVGYIGSRNSSNLFAIASFVKAAGNGSLFQEVRPVELHVGGSICQWLAEELGDQLNSLPNVKLLGHIENLSGFYSSLDIAINPVEFGTGLKIKNCEALAYGCPLITTTAGKQGMPDGLDRFVFVVENQEQMVDKLREMANDHEVLGRLRSQVADSARDVFSDDSAYSELFETLISSNPNQIR